MKRTLSYVLVIGAAVLAACAQPKPPPGKKTVVQEVRRPNRPSIFLYRDVPD
jgi:hypothetical protein